MPKFLIQYTDHSDDTNKEQIIGGIDSDDAECNLYRKIKCGNFTIHNIQQLINSLVNKNDA
jgi:hypothetical protein